MHPLDLCLISTSPLECSDKERQTLVRYSSVQDSSSQIHADGGLAASRRVSTGNQMLRTAFAVSRKQPAPTATPALNPRGSRTSTSSVAQRHLTHIPASFLAAMMFPIWDVTIGRNVATSPRSVGRGLVAVIALHANKIHHLHRCSTPRAPAAALLQHRTPASIPLPARAVFHWGITWITLFVPFSLLIFS